MLGCSQFQRQHGLEDDNSEEVRSLAPELHGISAQRRNICSATVVDNAGKMQLRFPFVACIFPSPLVRFGQLIERIK